MIGCAEPHTIIRSDSDARLFLDMPGARSVEFASSLDAFRIHKAEKIGQTRWGITVPVGSEFRYFYVVDGSVYLPECRFQEQDDFGTKNCIYIPER